MADFRPGLYYVGILPRPVADVDIEGIDLILQLHHRQQSLFLLLRADALHRQVQRQVAVRRQGFAAPILRSAANGRRTPGAVLPLP